MPVDKIYSRILAIWVLGSAVAVDQRIVHIVEVEQSRTGL